MFRAALIIGVGVQRPKDTKILDALRDADLKIDSIDLTRQHPQTGEDMFFLADDNTTILQHLPVQWVNLLNGVMRERSIENMLSYLERIPLGFAGNKSADWVRSLFEFEFNRDSETLIEEHLEELMGKPLFRETGGQGNTGFRSFVTDALGSILHLEKTKFWRDWYQGFLDGKPLDWGLQRRVALIPDADWEKGPEHIAGKIEEIKAAFLSEKTPLAETVEFNEATAKFHTVPREVAKPDLLGATLSQVEDALDDVLADGSNGLNDGSREVKVIRRTVAKYGNDPQRIEMDFTSVHSGLTRQIVVGDLPASEENIALQRALEEGALAIRGTDSEVAENRRILDTQKIAELNAEQKATLAEAKPLLVDISEGAMREGFDEDISFIVEDRIGVAPAFGPDDRNPMLAEYNETLRTLSRVANIGVLLRQFPEIIHKIDKSAAYKGARILTTIAAIIGIGIAIL